MNSHQFRKADHREVESCCKIRSVRISAGERYKEDFVPDERFEFDSGSSARALLIYDGSQTEGERVLDLSGNDNHSIWQRFDP